MVKLKPALLRNPTGNTTNAKKWLIPVPAHVQGGEPSKWIGMPAIPFLASQSNLMILF